MSYTGVCNVLILYFVYAVDLKFMVFPLHTLYRESREGRRASKPLTDKKAVEQSRLIVSNTTLLLSVRLIRHS